MVQEIRTHHIVILHTNLSLASLQRSFGGSGQEGPPIIKHIFRSHRGICRNFIRDRTDTYSASGLSATPAELRPGTRTPCVVPSNAILPDIKYLNFEITQRSSISHTGVRKITLELNINEDRLQADPQAPSF